MMQAQAMDPNQDEESFYEEEEEAEQYEDDAQNIVASPEIRMD